MQRVDHHATTGATIADLDVAGADAFVLCYLAPEDALVQARSVMRRLREKAPKGLLVSGFWQKEAGRDYVPEDRLGVAADALAACLDDVAGLVDHREGQAPPADAPLAITATG